MRERGRNGDRMREEGTPVRIAGILGHWTGRALERNAIPERT